MTDRHVAGVAAVTTVGLALVRFGTESTAARVIGSVSGGGGAPLLGTAGQTAVVYSLLIGTLAPVLTVGVTLGAGVYLGRRVDVETGHRELLRGVATGSGAVVGLAALAALVVNGVADVYAVATALATVLRLGGTLTLPLLVGSLAGAALVAFEGSGEHEDEGGAATVTARSGPSREHAVEDAGGS